ncbi:Sec-independent protein translocase subunit TatA [Nesterenkonia halophila]|uniref:Sec-independent protein translocase subunit TatA n=1 Tax=Nesterenkonia halophila TaxID=302044 RepID=UPI0012910D11|nr:Sec-independent protein translocase subunit TatA [Nesterenkonia halophila]
MSLGPWQIAIIALLIILLFGAPKLPQLAKSVGQSMRIFKSEVQTMSGESSSKDSSQESAEEGEKPAVEGRVVNAEDPSAQRSGEGAEQRRDRS